MRLHTVILLLLAFLLAGCGHRGATITIINHSSSPLTSVVVSGSGFSQSIGSLAAGEQRQVAVSPRGASGVRLDFNASGKHFSSKEQGYFESGGYRVTAMVAPNFVVSVDANLYPLSTHRLIRC